MIGSKNQPMLLERPQSWDRPDPPTTTPGLYFSEVPAPQGGDRHCVLCVACTTQVHSRSLLDYMRACTSFVDFHQAAICQLLQQAQEGSLKVSQAWALISRTDFINPY